MEGGKNFSGRLRCFREGFKLFLERWNWDFLWGSSWGYFKGVEHFSEWVKYFWRDWKFFKCRGWGSFIMVKTFLGSWRFSCRLEFFWRGNADIFPEVYSFFRGLKLFPVSWVSCQGVRDFPGGGRLIFFWRRFNFFFGGGWRRINLKISIFSWQSFTMYTPRCTNLKFKILFEENPVPIAIVRSNNISILFNFIYIFLQESSRKMCSKTHQVAQLTINLGSMLQYP